MQVNSSKITDNTATRVASAIKFGVGDFGLVPCVVIAYFSFYLLIIEKTVLSLRSYRLKGKNPLHSEIKIQHLTHVGFFPNIFIKYCLGYH